MRKEIFPFFLGQEEIAIDDRGRIRLPNEFYRVIIVRTNNLRYGQTNRPETYVALARQGEAAFLLDRKALYALAGWKGTTLHPDEEPIAIDFGTVEIGARRVLLPEDFRKKLENNLVILKASQQGEFFHVLPKAKAA